MKINANRTLLLLLGCVAIFIGAVSARLYNDLTREKPKPTLFIVCPALQIKQKIDAGDITIVDGKVVVKDYTLPNNTIYYPSDCLILKVENNPAPEQKKTLSEARP